MTKTRLKCFLSYLFFRVSNNSWQPSTFSSVHQQKDSVVFFDQLFKQLNITFYSFFVCMEKKNEVTLGSGLQI